MDCPPRRILLVATVGGFTHAAPILELGQVLSSRGHQVFFATLAGQESWADSYPFIIETSILGPAPSPEQLTAHYKRSLAWDPSKGISNVMDSKYMFDSFWTQSHKSLSTICQIQTTKPDMIIADFFVDAARDMHIQYQIPLAIVWPQMPFLMVPSPYIPGQPGFQVDMTLTSEYASLWSRLRNELFLVWALPTILQLSRWTKNMRRKAGVGYDLPIQAKPDYLVLVNSFWGLETPKDLPPLVAAVGPILGDEYPPLTGVYTDFLSSHDKTIYVALGSHIILPGDSATKILQGLCNSLASGLINGVIWAVSDSGREEFDLDLSVTIRGKRTTFGALLNESHPDFFFPTFAPQRAILEHPSTKIYFTHGGGSSANEGLYHGKPMIAMGFYFDQICNTARLINGGTAESLHKTTFTPTQVVDKIKLIAEDKDRNYARNCIRLKRIAQIASRTKHHAANLIEELMYDTELRFKDGKELRPMHLQTADMRMPFWKAKNWDLVAFSVFGMSVMIGGAWFVGKIVWGNRFLVKRWASNGFGKL
ncbi:putative UDP-glucoronosyl and UDP-glucosyl transferase [Tricladium varicosporioides]|nr:putative UDP-glucoronosyl and UDP-glucosyl transferase [Hymenoscyphus varicosporioides]